MGTPSVKESQVSGVGVRLTPNAAMFAHMKAQHSPAEARHGGSAKRAAEKPAAMVPLWSNPYTSSAPEARCAHSVLICR